MTKTIIQRRETEETPPAVNDNDAAALASAARDLLPNDFIGLPMKFVKGCWYVKDGQKETDIGITEIFVVDVLSFAEQWTRWENKKPTHKIGGRRVDGFISPPRHVLPDADKAGKDNDPWQEAKSLVLRNSGGELFTWATTSFGGEKAIGQLLDTFVSERHQHPGRYPAVTLTSKNETSSAHGTIISKPILQVVGWEEFGPDASPPGDRTRALSTQQALAALPKPEETKAVPRMRGDMDDEIPF